VAGEFFIDTSAWYPLLVRRHADHARISGALKAQVQRRRRVLTTNLVVAEAHALIMRWEGRKAALIGLQRMDESTDVMVYSTPQWEAIARRDWIERYTDQDFSLTDAVSFTVMRENRIADVLTLDQHFAAAGFTMLPEPG